MDMKEAWEDYDDDNLLEEIKKTMTADAEAFKEASDRVAQAVLAIEERAEKMKALEEQEEFLKKFYRPGGLVVDHPLVDLAELWGEE